MDRVPYNKDFCKAITRGKASCEHLTEDNMCDIEECIYNDKWVIYWENFDEFPPTGGLT